MEREKDEREAVVLTNLDDFSFLMGRKASNFKFILKHR
jgi:hypothetical protein